MPRTKIPVKEFARRHNTQPQNIYYYIRTGKLTLEQCDCCGNKVLDIEKAEQFMRAQKNGKVT